MKTKICKTATVPVVLISHTKGKTQIGVFGNTVLLRTFFHEEEKVKYGEKYIIKTSLFTKYY